MKKVILIFILSLYSFFGEAQSETTLIILYNSVQEACLNERNEANMRILNVKDYAMEERFLNKSNNRLLKLMFVQGRMHEIKKSTHELIAYLDSVKLSLLKQGGNNLTSDFPSSKSVIHRIHRDSCSPISLNLNNLKTEKTSYTLNSKDFGNHLIGYRTQLLEHIGNYTFAGKTRYFRKFSIPEGTRMDRLNSIVRDSLISQGTLEPEDPYTMAEVYVLLTAFETYGEPIIRGTLLDKITTITAIQHDIIRAYHFSIQHWNARVSSSALILNDIKVVCSSPSSAHQGDKVELDVFVGAYDCLNAPIISIQTEEGAAASTSNDGKVAFTMGDSNVKLKGTVKIMTKMGDYLTLPWETEILLEN